MENNNPIKHNLQHHYSNKTPSFKDDQRRNTDKPVRTRTRKLKHVCIVCPSWILKFI